MGLKSLEKFKLHIVRFSEANNFPDAAHEWELISIRFYANSKFAKEVCVIKNRYNEVETKVNAVYAAKFLKINCEKLFASFRQINKDKSRLPSDALLEFVYKNHTTVTENDYLFLLDLKSKIKDEKSCRRNYEPTDKQKKWIKDINFKIVKEILGYKTKSPTKE